MHIFRRLLYSNPLPVPVMDRYQDSCPMSQQELIDEFFIEHRVHILEIAAYLDRLDRTVAQNATTEFRYLAFKKALSELVSDEPGRIERIQMILSDQDVRLLEERDGQSAWGAPRSLPCQNSSPPQTPR